MCQFFSGVITREGVVYDLWKDSHEELLKKAGLKDTLRHPEFVRVELLPKNGDIFNHSPENWKLSVDQDFRPEWFSEEFAELEMKKAFKVVSKRVFLVGKKLDKIEGQKYRFLKDCEIGELRDTRIERIVNVKVSRMLGNSQVTEMRGNSIARDFRGDTPKLLVAKESPMKVKRV